jgi:hypothetical protein
MTGSDLDHFDAMAQWQATVAAMPPEQRAAYGLPPDDEDAARR